MLRSLLVAAALLLAQAHLSIGAQFHLTATSPFSATYELTLSGAETSPGSGIYHITRASGTRTDQGATVHVTGVNNDLLGLKQSATDNLLYLSPSSQASNPDGAAYFTHHGLGGAAAPFSAAACAHCCLRLRPRLL